MLALPDTEVGMGFLDKLLGRKTEAGEGAADSAKDTGQEAAGVSPDGKEALDLAEGESQVTEAEHRLDDIRDQALRTEDRIP